VVVFVAARKLSYELGCLVVRLTGPEKTIGNGPVVCPNINSIQGEESRQAVMFDPVFSSIES
jgi:hypothetical protein